MYFFCYICPCLANLKYFSKKIRKLLTPPPPHTTYYIFFNTVPGPSFYNLLCPARFCKTPPPLTHTHPILCMYTLSNSNLGKRNSRTSVKSLYTGIPRFQLKWHSQMSCQRQNIFRKVFLQRIKILLRKGVGGFLADSRSTR
jgi:hypothetical protein